MKLGRDGEVLLQRHRRAVPHVRLEQGLRTAATLSWEIFISGFM